MDRNLFVDHLDALLDVQRFEDYGPNGLQVEGRSKIARVALGVTACQALLDAAVGWKADALIVHHGLFWRSSATFRVERSLRRRLSTLLAAEMSLLAYHLPLDAHPDLGNNAGLARRLGGIEIEPAFGAGGQTIGIRARFESPRDAGVVFASIAGMLGRDPLVIDGGPPSVSTFGVVTGAAPRSVEEAARLDLDLFITGEASESVTHLAREEGIHFVAAGHHATERFGVQALGEFIAKEYGLTTRYFEIPNPV